MQGSATMNNSSGLGGFGALLFFILVVVFLMGIFYQAPAQTTEVGTQYSHGETKHGADSVIANQCLDSNGADFIFTPADNKNKKVALCLLPDGEGTAIKVMKYINGKWEEITAYVRKDLKTINDVISYVDEQTIYDTEVNFVKECWRGTYVP